MIEIRYLAMCKVSDDDLREFWKEIYSWEWFLHVIFLKRVLEEKAQLCRTKFSCKTKDDAIYRSCGLSFWESPGIASTLWIQKDESWAWLWK